MPNEKLLPLVRAMIDKGHTATIIVKGYSMRPFLEHLRDKVELESWKETGLFVGDAVLAEIAPGHFVLHRIIEIDKVNAFGQGFRPEQVRPDMQITLRGDGNVVGTEACKASDIAGKVLRYIRPAGHIMEASDPKLIKRIERWNRLYPFRRYLLFLYRASI
ncbi:MAG: hypothetical protein K6F94_06850 [Bacteroidaceae bacterium]|nr:hypothetical protein [Bacteroidaceae bacterium]